MTTRSDQQPGLFWKVDEDGEVVHRLQSEWDGNKGAWREWGDWRSQGDNWQINAGAMWSHWGVGVDYEWAHESTWMDGGRHRYRRSSLTFTLGPWCLGWMRCTPLDAAAGS